MAASTSEETVAHAISESRLLIFVGQRRAGLTTAALKISSISTDKGERHFIDLDSVKTIDTFCREIGRKLGVKPDPSAPGNFYKLFSATESDSGENLPSARPLIFIANGHAATDILEWIFRAMLSAPPYGEDRRPRFFIEGAIDPDRILHSAFPNTPPDAPYVQYAEAPTPWRLLSDFEDRLTLKFPRLSPNIIPWLADISGGDVRLADELAARLSHSSAHQGEADLQAACAAVLQGRTALQIKAAATACQSNRFLVKALAGEIFSGVSPNDTQDDDLKSLYLAGILSFDRALRIYRIRSPLLTAILTSSPHEDSTIMARTCFLICHVAEVELRLRWRISKCQDYIQKAKSTLTVSRWGDIGKSIRAAAAHSTEFPNDKLGILDKLLTATIPKNTTCYDVAKERSGLADGQIDSSLLSHLTFSELAALAKDLLNLTQAESDAITRLNKARNDIAHFRPIQHDHFTDTIGVSIKTLRRICQATPQN